MQSQRLIDTCENGAMTFCWDCIPAALPLECTPARAKQNACNAAQSITTAISVHIGNGCRIDLLPGFDPPTLHQALAVLRD